MDITLCKGEDCPKKELCIRFLAKPMEINNHWLKRPPYILDVDKDGKPRFSCDMYREVKKDYINKKY
jgi:hypothetical protein